MPTITVVLRDGSERQVEGAIGFTLMETLRDSGIDELLALCGGVCSCATCHVHIDSDHIDQLATMSEDENELLESASDRDTRSRLSCQVPLSEALDGMRVVVADED